MLKKLEAAAGVLTAAAIAVSPELADAALSYPTLSVSSTPPASSERRRRRVSSAWDAASALSSRRPSEIAISEIAISEDRTKTETTLGETPSDVAVCPWMAAVTLGV